MRSGPIRVLIVDDSALMRRMIADMIAANPAFAVAGTACNGREAVEKSQTLRPDVITMDIEMPVMDGITALAEIMQRQPTPVVMLSSRTRHGATETLRSLELGAVDFVCKPSGAISMDLAEVRHLLWSKVRLAASARLLAGVRTQVSSPAPVPSVRRAGAGPADLVVVIAASTGGPRALEEVIPRLPADLPACVLVAQHMPAGFTSAMAARLDSLSALSVREAADRDVVDAGSVLVAPGGKHLVITPARRAATEDGPPVWGVRPAAVLLMRSAAEVYGSACVGVVLTGMGRDGAEGAAAIRRAGGRVVAQDEATSVVYGMPKAAVEHAGVDASVPLDLVAKTVCQLVERQATRVHTP